MFVPTATPKTLQEMKTFLTPCIASGIFTDVVLDNDSSPTAVWCKAGEEEDIILSLTVNSSYSWTFTPYTASGAPGTPAGRCPGFVINYAARCSGGVIFSASATGFGANCFFIGKTAAGKTACAAFNAPGVTSYSAVTIFPTVWGDNTAVPRYSNGFNLVQNGMTNDRTILQIVPVFGGTGSVDYFDTVRFRNMAQYSEAGVQIIGGKRYGCVGFFAIKDEEASA